MNKLLHVFARAPTHPYCMWNSGASYCIPLLASFDSSSSRFWVGLAGVLGSDAELKKLLLMVEIPHGSIYQKCRNYGSIVYMWSCRISIISSIGLCRLRW